jgi:predicted TIM-barrel fold metal-dependent hydrolase
MVAKSKRTAKDGMVVVDCDVHINDLPQFLAPHCVMPWRKSLELLGKTPQRYLDIPGFSPGFKQYPPIPGGQPARSVNTAAELREELDAIDIDYGILIPDHLLLFALLPNMEYAIALSQAYNRWLEAEWLEPGNGFFGAIMACPQNPEESAKEIERYAGKPGFVAVYLPTAGVDPLWGHRRYDPIMAAAEAADLPVILHSVTVTAPVFPAQINQFENQFGRQVIGHAFSMMANMVSLMHTGVPARYPNLKIVFTEAGVAWVPSMLWRMDRYHAELRRTVPFLDEKPSDYVKRQMWFATQPIEEPQLSGELAETIEHCGGADRVVFASDWPHHDFDHPRAMRRVPLADADRRKIMGENAMKLFKLPMPARLAEAEPA